jgi:hypothetical protein
MEFVNIYGDPRLSFERGDGSQNSRRGHKSQRGINKSKIQKQNE